MAERPTKNRAAPGFVVLRQMGPDTWQFLGEVPRKQGASRARPAPGRFLDATGDSAIAGETYAAVLRSEWRIALDSAPPG